MLYAAFAFAFNTILFTHHRRKIDPREYKICYTMLHAKYTAQSTLLDDALYVLTFFAYLDDTLRND